MIRPYRSVGFWPKVRSRREHLDHLDIEHTKLVDMAAGGSCVLGNPLELHGRGMTISSASVPVIQNLTAGYSRTTSQNSLAATGDILYFNRDVTTTRRLFIAEQFLPQLKVVSIFGTSAYNTIDPADGNVFLTGFSGTGQILHILPPQSGTFQFTHTFNLRVRGGGDSTGLLITYDADPGPGEALTTDTSPWFIDFSWKPNTLEYRPSGWGGIATGDIYT